MATARVLQRWWRGVCARRKTTAALVVWKIRRAKLQLDALRSNMLSALVRAVGCVLAACNSLIATQSDMKLVYMDRYAAQRRHRRVMTQIRELRKEIDEHKWRCVPLCVAGRLRSSQR